MNKLIILVFVLNFLCKHCHCGQAFSDLKDKSRKDVKFPSDDLCNCVQSIECEQENILNGKCLNEAFNGVDPNLVCCRRRPTERPSQKPETSTQSSPEKSTKIQPRIPPSQPTTRVPSRTTTQIPVTNSPSQTRPQDTPQGSSINANCTCMPQGECHNKDVKKNSRENQENCPNPNVVCCPDLVQQVTTPLPQPHRPKPSQRPTQNQTLVTSPRPQIPSSTQPPPPADKNCICTPFFDCYDEETSSNLTGVVNDRRFIPNNEESCPDPNDICCYNLVKITAKPILVKSSSKVCPAPGSCVGINECPYMFNKANEGKEGNSEAIQELRKSVCSHTNGTIRVCCQPNDSPLCKFPFTYESVTYSTCTATDDPDGKPWCSTQTDNRNNHIKDQWRPCTSYDTLVAAGN